MSETQLRKEIAEKVKELYKLRKENEKPFVPGETYVNYAGRVYDENEMENLVDSSLDFWLTAGKHAETFERELSKFIGVKYCSLVNSGSSANLIAISALTSSKLGDRRLRAGDEVITTACGFPTTLNPIIQNNLVPVLVDVDIETYNIDMKDNLKEVISPKTKAIFIPHTLGNPAYIRNIQSCAKDNNLWFIEDNCDALGSKYMGKYTGSFGDISTCSFYPAHHITMGEGGAVLTNNPQLHKIINSFRDWGRDCWCDPGKDNTCTHRFDQQWGNLPKGYDHKYVYSHIGYNLKATDMQAAIGVEQLKKLPDFIAARRKNFFMLLEGLYYHSKYLVMPHGTKETEPSWFGFPILVKETAPFTRNDIVEYLENHKVATRMLFGGNLTKQPAYLETTYRIAGNLNNTDNVMNNLFWIGLYPGMTEEMIKYTLKTFSNFMKEMP